LVCVIIIRYFLGELRWIPSGSMRPTILERDRVFVEKLDFPKKDIKREVSMRFCSLS
ncbi:S26 family signal peptidase, partial [bacterium]|nr:S26 family signal peptidase [bacterium]